MSGTSVDPHRIELRLRNTMALFNSMDPSPFPEKDLDDEAEAFIVSWAREHPTDVPLVLRVHLEDKPTDDPAPLITEAVHNYFRYRSDMLAREFRQLMKQARTSLFIGLSFLALCLVVSRYLLPEDGNTLTNFLRESLIIAGWVAMWRPIELYLYDWWPLRRKEQLYKRLSRMRVEVAKPRPQTP
jgi:hypothetical protein